MKSSRVAPGVLDVELVFVVGASDADLRPVEEILVQLGLASLSEVNGLDRGQLITLNDSILARARGSREALPALSPQGLARSVLEDEEQVDIVRRALELTPGDGRRVLCWADPALSILNLFWQGALSVRASTVFAHDLPRSGPASSGLSTHDDDLAQWARYNRSALMGCFDGPCFIVNGDQMRKSAKVVIEELDAFLTERHGTMARQPMDDIVRRAEENWAGSGPDSIHLTRSYVTLANLLGALDGPHRSSDGAFELDRLSPVLESFYDDEYYSADYDQSGVPYQRSEALWRDRFAALARGIVETLAPRSVLDVGCASGMLVEALRQLGVDATGVDISEAAVEQVPPPLRPYCKVGSILDDFGSKYDLIVCSEVVEHLLPFVASSAISNLCAHADTVLFSSTPDDFAEPTHLNVQTGDYWGKLFLRNGFTRDGFRDASFLAPHAAIFRRTGDKDESTLVEGYEWAMSKLSTSLGHRLDAAMEEYRNVSGRLAALEREYRLAGVNFQAVAGLEMVRRNEIAYRRLAHFLNVRTDQFESSQAEIAALQNTKLFRYARNARRLYGRVRKAALRPARSAPEPQERPFGPTYKQWVGEFERLDADEMQELNGQIAAIPNPPLISLIMPVYDPDVTFLRDAIESARAQVYPHWQLCIADDCSPSDDVVKMLREYAAVDDRIRVIERIENGHISAASNSALELSDGDWICCLDHDDVLPPFALAIAAREIARHPGVGLLYSDDDKIDVEGTRYGPYFKPDFDRLLLLGQNYLSHLCLYRRDLVEAVGGFRLGLEGSQDWDLALRVTERLDEQQVVHIPHVLYHWRSHEKSAASSITVKPYAARAGLHAVEDYITRNKLSASAEGIGDIGHNRVTWNAADPKPYVTVVVVASEAQTVRPCVESILTATDYSSFDIVITGDDRAVSDLERVFGSPRVRVEVQRSGRHQNPARRLNDVVNQRSEGEVCIVSGDCVVSAPGWLEELLGHLGRPQVGAVGGKIHRSDGRIWSAGYALGVEGVAYPIHRNDDGTSTGYFGKLIIAHEVSAVSKDLMVIKREAWEAVRGFDSVNVPMSFTDVDFCLRLREAGWTTIWTPYSEATQLVDGRDGNEGDGAGRVAAETAYMQARWSSMMVDDPCYNPNLTLAWGDLSPAWPPRVRIP